MPDVRTVGLPAHLHRDGDEMTAATTAPGAWMDESLPREQRLEAALAAIRDNTPHVEDTDTYCPACLAAVALNPKQHGMETA
jgi:hypothetical protein